MKHLITIALIITSLSDAISQPELDSWMMNTTGATASYDDGMGTVTISDSVNVLQMCSNSTHVYVRCEGLAEYEMGPFIGNPNAPSAQGYIFKIARNPAEETGTKEDNPWAGPLGVAVNGVVIYGFGDARSYDIGSNSNSPMGQGVWNSDAWLSEGSTMDATGAGHPDQNGNYHHHATPIALYSDPSTSHSPVVGFAFDGFPIYGPFGYSSPMDNASTITRITSGYALRSITTRTILPDGSTASSAAPNVGGTFPLGTYSEDYEHTGLVGDLDAYNGRMCVTPEYPSGTYAYFVTTDASGDPAFPYFVGPTYYGVVSSSDIGPNAGNATIPGGVNCGTVGIDDSENIRFRIVASPNPFNKYLLIQLEEELDNTQIHVSNSLGQVVLSQSILGREKEIILDSSLLISGFYTIHFVKNGEYIGRSIKVVKL